MQNLIYIASIKITEQYDSVNGDFITATHLYSLTIILMILKKLNMGRFNWSPVSFINLYTSIPELKDEIKSALTLLPFIASTVGGMAQDLEDFISGIDEDFFDMYLQYALVKVSILDQDYLKAMTAIGEVLNTIDNDIDATLLELEAAHLYLIMILENMRSLPDTKYKPHSYEEYFALEEELLKKMMNFIEEKKDEEEIPVITRLVVSNYPNPFNPIMTIDFS